MYLTGSLLGGDGEYALPLIGRYMPLWSVFIGPFRNFPYLRVFLVWPFRRGLEFFSLMRLLLRGHRIYNNRKKSTRIKGNQPESEEIH